MGNLNESLPSACTRINFVDALALTKYWFSMTNGADAPAQQLQLFKDLTALRQYHPSLVDACLERFQAHLWFLTEEMTPLALTSDLVNDQDRAAIAKVLFTIFVVAHSLWKCSLF